MLQTKKNIIHSLMGIVLGGCFLYLTLHNKPFGPIWESLAGADIFWIVISGFCLLLIFYIRALRWKILLSESGQHTTSSKIFTALLIGYFVNSFTPKLGEIIRCTCLKHTSQIPLSDSMGTVMAERIYDVAILILGLGAVIILQLDRLQVLIDSTVGGISHIYGYHYLIAVPFLISVVFSLLLLSHHHHRDISHKWVIKLIDFLKNMFHSLSRGFHLKRSGRFILLTALIWILLVVLNLCFLKALPETKGFPPLFSLVVLFVGGIGWALPSPGGIGTTHFFLLQLFLAYDLEPNAGISFGLLSNGLTFIFTILFGLWALLRFKTEKKESIIRLSHRKTTHKK